MALAAFSERGRAAVNHPEDRVGIFSVMCLLAVALNIVLYRHAGTFWRDEATTIQLAVAPQFSTMWAWLSRDSFPALFASLLRLWIIAGPGATDAGIRLFGTLVSLGVLVSLSAGCWMLAGRVPLLAMSLVAFNVDVFYFGSSLRAYGLGLLLIMLCYAAFWRLASNPTLRNVAASLVLAVLSVHTNYQNTYLLLGIGMAGASVCTLCRLWKRSTLILGLCFVAAVSMLIYVPAITENREGHEVTSYALDWWTIAATLAESLAGGSKGLLFAWVAMILAACALLSGDIYRRFRSHTTQQAPSLSLFCLLATTVAGAAGLFFSGSTACFPRLGITCRSSVFLQS